MDNTIPRLEQRANGYWYAVWFDRASAHTRRCSMGTKDAGSAGPRFAAWLSEFYAGQVTAAVRPATVLSVEQVLFDYVQEHVEPKVVDKARVRGDKGQYVEGEEWNPSGLVGNLRAGFPGVAVSELDIPRCRAYTEGRYSGRIGRKASSGTIRREIGCLIAAINHAVAWKRLTRGDVPILELPPQPMPRERWLTKEELARLFEAAAEDIVHGDGGRYERGDSGRLPRLYRFVTGCYYTASRGGAIRHLDWFRIDLKERFIRLNPPGRRQTAKRRPTVPIDPRWLPDLLRAERERTGSFYLDHPGAVRKQFAAACRRAGLEGVTPHVLRHTRIMHMLLDRLPLKAISDMSGDTIATLERTYIHAAPIHLRQELEDAYSESLAEVHEGDRA